MTRKDCALPASLRVRGREAGTGQGCTDWQSVAGVMKSFSKTRKKTARGDVREDGERFADRLLLHAMSLRCTSCLPAFIIDTGQPAASMAPYRHILIFIYLKQLPPCWAAPKKGAAKAAP
jgi:hypothetical protein